MNNINIQAMTTLLNLLSPIQNIYISDDNNLLQFKCGDVITDGHYLCNIKVKIHTYTNEIINTEIYNSISVLYDDNTNRIECTKYTNLLFNDDNTQFYYNTINELISKIQLTL